MKKKVKRLLIVFSSIIIFMCTFVGGLNDWDELSRKYPFLKGENHTTTAQSSPLAESTSNTSSLNSPPPIITDYTKALLKDAKSLKDYNQKAAACRKYIQVCDSLEITSQEILTQIRRARNLHDKEKWAEAADLFEETFATFDNP